MTHRDILSLKPIPQAGWPHYALAAFAAFLALIVISIATPSAGQDAPPPNPNEEQPEVLTRGPVHEAFAQPVNLEPEAGVTAPKAPPPPINEEPPVDKPEGDNYVWIPGYWSWDADRSDYVWVSACWRVAPANMSWVPGYWDQTDDSWEWVAGFWKSGNEQDIEYLPAPPQPEDAAPPGPPPSPEQVWVPPCHYWVTGQYVPRRGYWLAPHEGWVWVPSHYLWTPHGHVFCEGHWDVSLERRGVLFSPVYIPQAVYTRVGYTYSPSIVVETTVLQTNCFTSPRYCHYYFGDYYDDAYVKIGIYPRIEVEHVHTWYDPIFVYDRWHHRSDTHWVEEQRHEFQIRHDDVKLRPARTYREQEIRVAKLPERERASVRVAQPLKNVVASKTTHIKFQQINGDERKKIQTQATEVHKFVEQRNTWEGTGKGKTVTTPKTERTVTPKEPIKEPTIRPKEPLPKTEERKVEERKVEEHKTVTPTEHKAPVVAPRDTHRTEPEKVKIPTPSISGKERSSGPADKTPTPPTNERQHRDSGKDDGKGK